MIAPGSACDRLQLEAGLKEIKNRGFGSSIPLDPTVCLGKSALTSADPADRAEALMSLVADPAVAAILSVRGGYGSMQLLPLLDYKAIGQARKPIVGYSDVSALLAVIAERSLIPTIHGPAVAVEFASSQSRESVEMLFSLLTDPNYRLEAECEIIRSGVAEGSLLAGNLSTLVSLLGTPWDLNYVGKILAIEDVSEPPYRIHRMLTQLGMAGKLDGLAGVVFGSISRAESGSGPSIREVLEKSTGDVFVGTSYPILMGLGFGHEALNTPLPIGCRARIEENRFSVLESPLGK